jgi:hypothetical protein
MMIKLEEIVAMVSRWCPELVVKEEIDGNIVISLNMKLKDNDYLVSFETEYDLTGEDI